MGSLFFKILEVGDIGEVMVRGTAKLGSIAEGLSIPAIVVYFLGAVVAIAAGLLSYKFIKVCIPAVFGAFGYALGAELSGLLVAFLEMETVIGLEFLMGAACAVLFGFISYKKYLIGFSVAVCAVGFVAGYFIIPNLSIAIGCGVLLALISVFYVRPVFTVITAWGGGLVVVSMLSAMLPQFTFLKLNEGILGLLVACAIACAFLGVQFVTTKDREKEEREKVALAAKRRFKRRRVFED